MSKRKIIEIDRELCNGCALCTTACAEGALALDHENKAVLLKEIYCDGLGACLDVCPTAALRIIERESTGYDARAAFDHVLETRGRDAAQHVHGIGHSSKEILAPVHGQVVRAHVGGGCPGSLAREIRKPASTGAPSKSVSGESELSQWPVQLRLVSPFAPYFNHSDLLVAADCTAFALAAFHQDLLKGKKLVIACPKLDDTTGYVDKLAGILQNNAIRSLTVAIMEVPCCSGLAHIVDRAVEQAGVAVGVKTVVVGIDGSVHRDGAAASAGC